MMKAVFDWFVGYYHKLASPKYFYELTGLWLPWFAVIAAALIGTGVIWGLAFAPEDYQQGNSFRIIYIHVPAASLAMMAYLTMAISGAVGLIWKIKVAEMVAKSCAGVGASVAFLALVTGAIWGKPTWGTYWIWDARLTSMLILLFLYLGVISLQSSIRNPVTAAKAAAVLSLVGAVNIPIIKYSVEWWNTLHQPATIKLTEKSTMAPEMLIPLILSIFGFYFFFAVVVMMQTRNEILEREKKNRWVKELL